MAKRILVVEDEDVVRSIIVEAIRSEGFEVMEAKKGDEAIEVFLAENPDLVILDIIMPDMDGLEVCQAIRKLPEPLNKTPIIMLTAIDTRLGKRLGEEAGADVYLTKPFSPKELRQKIKELLASSEAKSQ